MNTIAGSTPDPTAATAPSTFQNRLWLWQLGASLVRDAPFTGMGIGMFEMPFALYAVLIHVGIVEHAHNLYLDIAIEQGVLGAVAFAVMAISALWWGLRTRSAQVSRLRALDPRLPQQTLILESVMASLSTILIHGLIDDALYSSRGILLFLVPLGLLTALGRLSNGPSTIDQLRPGIWNQLRPTVQSVGITVALTTAAIGGIVWFSGTADQSRGVPWMQRWQAAWHANLGVVRQARIEIAAYDQVRFSNLSIEDVRRQEDLTPASRQFEIAIAIDPRNVTALRRRTLIALATHDYDQAYALMQTVWGAGHRDPVSRLLYGDALVAMGRSDEAVSIIKGLPFAGARLEGQAWDRYQKHGDLERADDARRAAQLVH